MSKGICSGLVALALVCVAPALARADAPLILKFAFPAPVSSYVNTEGMTPWIHKVETASDGTLEIKLFAGPTLASTRNVYERTLTGVAQLSFGIFGPFAAQFPRTQVADLPFISTSTTESSVALWRVFAKGLLAPEYDKIKVLALFNFPSALLSTNKPIKTMDDLKGMKLAVASRVHAELVSTLGGTPVTLTPPEHYEAMSRGVVDGIVVAWTAVRTFRLPEVTKDHLEAPLGEAPAFVFMNKATYASLPAKAKAAIDGLSGEAFSKTLGHNNEMAGVGESKVVAAMAGHHVSKLSAAEYKLWKARIQPIIADWAKSTPNGAKILAAYENELKKIGATN
jgi:TRAP-type C4-dicarboxylate transport system substrate-binding protein